MASDPWAPPPAGPLAAAADEVHVWRASLRPPAHVLARLEAHLSPDERARAARFRFPEHRTAFVAGRGTQREILSRYAGLPPHALAYRETAHGKQSLTGVAADIRYNVSNSGDLALYAVTLGREVGVDLERIKPMPDGLDIAQRFFSAPENEIFAALAADEAVRDVAFFNCWTRKEAYIKAVGEGLSMPLDRFDVAFAPGEPAALLRTRGDEDEAARWTMRALEPGPGYAGALVVEGDGWRPVLFHFATE